MANYVQQYLITGDGIEPFTTDWFDETYYNHHINMVVYDLHNDLFTSDGVIWQKYNRDNL